MGTSLNSAKTTIMRTRASLDAPPEFTGVRAIRACAVTLTRRSFPAPDASDGRKNHESKCEQHQDKVKCADNLTKLSPDVFSTA